MAKSADAFRTISEVADWLETPAHVLRFWESKFSQVKPVKRAGGRRYYRPADMRLLGGIKKLLHDDGMTIKGVQKVLREQGVKHVSGFSQPLDDLMDESAGDIALDVEPERRAAATVVDLNAGRETRPPDPSAAPPAPAPVQEPAIDKVDAAEIADTPEAAADDAPDEAPADRQEPEDEVATAPLFPAGPAADTVTHPSEAGAEATQDMAEKAPPPPDGPDAPADVAHDEDDAAAPPAQETAAPVPEPESPPADAGEATAPVIPRFGGHHAASDASDTPATESAPVADAPADAARPDGDASAPAAAAEDTPPKPTPLRVEVPDDPGDDVAGEPGVLSRLQALPHPLPDARARALRPLLTRLQEAVRPAAPDDPD